MKLVHLVHQVEMVCNIYYLNDHFLGLLNNFFLYQAVELLEIEVQWEIAVTMVYQAEQVQLDLSAAMVNQAWLVHLVSL